MKTEFAHREDKGISLGITVHNKVVYFVGAFVNTLMGDRFSKKRARLIINGRTKKLITGKTVEGFYRIWENPVEFDSYKLSRKFKELFYTDDSVFLYAPPGNPLSFVYTSELTFEKCCTLVESSIEELRTCAD